MEPLRNQEDYGEKGHRPQDFTEDELVQMAKELSIMAKEMLAARPKDLLKSTNVNADKYLKKDMEEIGKSFERMRSSIGMYQQGKRGWSAEDVKDDIYGLIDELEKLHGSLGTIARSLRPLVEAVNKEELRREEERQNADPTGKMTDEEFAQWLLRK